MPKKGYTLMKPPGAGKKSYWIPDNRVDDLKKNKWTVTPEEAAKPTTTGKK